MSASERVNQRINGKFIGNSEAAREGNEALANGFSLHAAAEKARKKTGQGPGIYESDWQQRSARASAAASAAAANLTLEQRSARSSAAGTSTAANSTPEQRSARARAAANALWANLTPEQRSARASAASKTGRANRG